MAFLFPVLMVLIFVLCLAFLNQDGMWNNGLRLINVVTAALLAVNFFEPVTRMIEGFGEMFESFTFYLDFAVLWLLFTLIMLILRMITDTVSRVKVRFLSLADRIGGAFFAAWIGWVMVCFTAMSLHTAPLGRNFLFGGFQPEKRILLLAPDRQWLGFTQKMSRGTFSRSSSDVSKYGSEADEAEKNLCVFDRNGDFLPKYTARRTAFEKNVSTRKSATVVKADFGTSVKKR